MLLLTNRGDDQCLTRCAWCRHSWQISNRCLEARYEDTSISAKEYIKTRDESKDNRHLQKPTSFPILYCKHKSRHKHWYHEETSHLSARETLPIPSHIISLTVPDPQTSTISSIIPSPLSLLGLLVGSLDDTREIANCERHHISTTHFRLEPNHTRKKNSPGN